MKTPDNELSPDELKIILLWRKNGGNMTAAYKQVMIPKGSTITNAALKKRVLRFFKQERIRAAMEATDGNLGEKTRIRHKKELQRQQKEALSKFSDDQKNDPYIKTVIGATLPIQLEADLEQAKSAQERYRESLQMNGNVDSISVTESAKMVLNYAITEMLERKKAIRERGVDVLDQTGKGSALTKNIIYALKTTADILLPFAPPPTTAERREMSKAGQILCSLISGINENPDDYAVSSNYAIDVTIAHKDSNDD